jgi:hypothetical protein
MTPAPNRPDPLDSDAWRVKGWRRRRPPNLSEDPDSLIPVLFSQKGGLSSLDLPQVAEINTPRPLDVAGEH